MYDLKYKITKHILVKLEHTYMGGSSLNYKVGARVRLINTRLVGRFVRSHGSPIFFLEAYEVHPNMFGTITELKPQNSEALIRFDGDDYEFELGYKEFEVISDPSLDEEELATLKKAGIVVGARIKITKHPNSFSFATVTGVADDGVRVQFDGEDHEWFLGSRLGHGYFEVISVPYSDKDINLGRALELSPYGTYQNNYEVDKDHD